VLYHVQWDDELSPRDGQFELFGALASADKRLIARPGPHAQTHPDDEAAWQEFIRLNAVGPPAATPPGPGTAAGIAQLEMWLNP
jgi:hypothetical protein